MQLIPSQIPDITLGHPLILSGRYKGEFPDEIELRGTLADMSCFTIELTVQKAKDIPLDKVTYLLSYNLENVRNATKLLLMTLRKQVLARRQIDELTARAWFEDKKELEEKVVVGFVI